MAFIPSVLKPVPDSGFVKELKLIDPALRVVWGYERYFLNRWVIERKLSAERYFAAYASLLKADAERFVERPIFDDDHNENVPIGFQRYDLAPEYDCLMTVENADGSYRPLDARTIMALKRQYAWEVKHPFSRIRYEDQRTRELAMKELAQEEASERADRKAQQDKEAREAVKDALDAHRNQIWDRVSVAVP